ncbi:MAG: type II secretion system F family protein [Patescibacteria group bacterium]
MLFVYKAINQSGNTEKGELEAFNVDNAINILQKRSLIISSIKERQEGNSNLLSRISFFNKVSNKDIVILSRQISTLFEAQVSALRVFTLIASEAENPKLRKKLFQVVDDLQGGNSISGSLSKHPDVFSDFYVNMVRSGEESGKIDKTFSYLADYLDRTYEVTTKAKNALIYPAFVIFTFIAVMVLMFTVIVPKIGAIIKDSGQEVPFYTKMVFTVSDFFVNGYIFIIMGLVLFVILSIWYMRTPEGRAWISNARLFVPYVGDLYRKLYVSRFADNMSTMVSSGIPMLKAIEVTASVIDNQRYKDLLEGALIQVKAGKPLSEALGDSDDMPRILVQMIKVGEESGETGNILKTMATFYQREVMNAVDTLVSLIEPVMIVVLGVGVGILLASVLMPIYNIAGSI